MPPKFKSITFNFIPIKPNLSTDKVECRRRVLNLYKSWYRQLPIILYDYRMNMSPEDARSKLREIFLQNSRIQDVKLINTLVLRGQMELNETVNKQKELCHLHKYFRSDDRKPQDFLTKFLQGR